MVLRMFSENLEQFRRIVVEDEALQQQLVGVAERDEFIRRVVELGAAYGYVFTAADVQHALHASRRAWLKQKSVQ